MRLALRDTERRKLLRRMPRKDVNSVASASTLRKTSGQKSSLATRCMFGEWQAREKDRPTHFELENIHRNVGKKPLLANVVYAYAWEWKAKILSTSKIFFRPDCQNVRADYPSRPEGNLGKKTRSVPGTNNNIT